MSAKRITPDEAAKLLEEGWRYVDVRSVAEFEQGHVPGAFNVPLMHFAPGQGMTPNNDFLKVFTASFTTEDRLVVGCKSGGRSLRAVEALEKHGYKNLVDMRGGYHGEPAQGGGMAVDGWAARGLPTTNIAEQGRSYQTLAKSAGGAK